VTDLNYELAPRPGMTTSQRKAELDQARFVAVRNLAYMVYKKPDGQALMTYQETLDDRERVKAVVIQHELALGLLTNDAGAPVVAAPGPAMAPGIPPNGAPHPGMMTAPAGGQVVPMTPMAAPAPPAVAQVAPPASPQQAVAAAAPQEQAAPAAPTATPTGRRRRTTQPAADAGAQQAMVPVAAPPQAGMIPVGQVGMPAPSYAAPAPAPGGYVQPQVQVPAPQVQPHLAAPTGAVPQVDAGLLARVDSIGQGLSGMSKDVDELKVLLYEALAALQHIYAQQPGLAKPYMDGKVITLPDFRRYLKTFTGNPS
jgi:hypothetical protein